MLARLWEENKRFLVVAGSAFLVFLVLNGAIGSYLARADRVLDSAAQLERKIRALKKELDHGFAAEQNRLSSYEAHEEGLLKEIILPPMEELSAFDEAAPRVQFNKAIDRVWGRALETANRMGVAIPEKLGPEDFAIDRGDGKAQYERYYHELAVIGGALNALVEAGMAEIQRPQLVNFPDDPILGSEGFSCRLRGAGFVARGTYDSFVRLLKSVQDPERFLQVRVMELKPVKGEEHLVQGSLDFAGLLLASGSEDGAEDGDGDGGVPRPLKRRRR
jgi:hypothetical protein